MIEHLSYSSITTFLDCPENWRRKYLAKEPTKSSPALVFGSAFHSTVEQIVSVPDTDILKSWTENWDKAIQKETIDWGEDTPEQHFNEGVRMLKSKSIADEITKIKPAHDEAGPKVERKVELSVPGVPIPIIGYIDIILSDGTPGDFKTSKASWADAKAEDSLQSLFYIAALNQMGQEVNYRFAHLIFVKTKEPKFQRIEHSHKPSELFFLFQTVHSVWQSIEAEVFPLSPTSWKCNAKFCDFYANCRGRFN